MPASPRPHGPQAFRPRVWRAATWLLVATMAGCASPSQRPPPAPVLVEPSLPAPTEQLPPPPLAVPDATPPATTPPATAPRPVLPDPWQRLRAGLRFAACDAPDPNVVRARERLLRDRAALQRQLAQVAPALSFVLQAIDAVGLPTEFALLPLVESGYRALPATGNRPAGPWQFMPATARAKGLRIDRTRDARLDFAASTDAALRLLARLGEAFDGDWALATMAFNTGEFRVRRAIAAQPGAPAGVLRLGDVTRGHLARLRALSCIVDDPDAAGIVLPSLPADAALVAVPLQAGVPLSEVARWTGMPLATLRALNAARRDGRVGAGERIMLPAAAAPAFGAAHARWIAAGGAGAGEYVVRAGDSLWTIARRHGTTVRELARHNRIDAARPLRPGQVLLLPHR